MYRTLHEVLCPQNGSRERFRFNGSRLLRQEQWGHNTPYQGRWQTTDKWDLTPIQIRALTQMAFLDWLDSFGPDLVYAWGR